MTVYHGGTDEIQLPSVSVGRDGLDFGPGFYVTDIREQAEEWARRIADRRGLPPIINVYELDITKAKEEFRYLAFEHYDKAWLDFIAESRKEMRPWQDYDLIEGGVANDRVVDTVEAYIAGLISVELALSQLSYHKPNNQFYLLSQELTNRCLRFQRFIKF